MSLTNASPESAAKAARTASYTLATLAAPKRNDALQAIHDALLASKDDILAANAKDLELAGKAAADGKLSQALVSRLDLGKKGKFDDMLKGILDVKNLPDPSKLRPSSVCGRPCTKGLIANETTCRSWQRPDAHEARR